MEEKKLLYIALTSAIIGILSLFFISSHLSSNQIPISQITPEYEGSNVRICGKITSKTVTSAGHVFLTIKDNSGSIKVVAFNDTAEKLGIYYLEKYDNICVSGKVKEYKGELEVLLSKNSKIEMK